MTVPRPPSPASGYYLRTATVMSYRSQHHRPRVGASNQIWIELVLLAQDLPAWTQPSPADPTTRATRPGTPRSTGRPANAPMGLSHSHEALGDQVLERTPDRLTADRVSGRDLGFGRQRHFGRELSAEDLRTQIAADATEYWFRLPHCGHQPTSQPQVRSSPPPKVRLFVALRVMSANSVYRVGQCGGCRRMSRWQRHIQRPRADVLRSVPARCG